MGNLLNEIYPNFELRQEYPVNQVNKDFNSGREKFDWVVLGLDIVIEVHGKQHYEPICFGGILMSQARKNFEKRVRVDKEKQDAALEAGFAYVVVKYDEKKLTAEELSDKVTAAIESAPRKLRGSIRVDRQSSHNRPKIQSRGFDNGPKQKIQSRGFQKLKRKIRN